MFSYFRFPDILDTMITSPEHLEERRAALEVYLNTVLEQEMYREQMDVVSQTRAERSKILNKEHGFDPII